MKLKSIQTQYIQKSRIFLYPLLGVERGAAVTPVQTYLGWLDKYTVKDRKLICVYHLRDDVEFKSFIEDVVMKNEYYSDSITTDDKKLIIVFDLSPISKDYDKIINGNYSLLSDGTKNKISKFFINRPKNRLYILSYLQPDRFIDNYAEILDVDPIKLKTVGELCSKPDLIEEILVSK